MLNQKLETTSDMVFDFESPEFTQVELATALYEMVGEFTRLSQQVDEAKTESKDLKDKLVTSSCLQRNEVDILKVKLSLLTTENENMQKIFHETLNENKRLMNLVNAWNKSSVSIEKMHERKKLGGEFGLNEGSTSETKTQPLLGQGG